MALEYDLRLKNKKLTEEILKKKLESMGYSCKTVKQLANGICIDLFAEAGFMVWLTDSGNPPYDAYDSDLLGREFPYEEDLCFQLDKEWEDVEERYHVLLKMVFELMEELQEEAVLACNWDAEICYFNGIDPVVLNNEWGHWDIDCFQEVIVGREIVKAYRKCRILKQF